MPEQVRGTVQQRRRLEPDVHAHAQQAPRCRHREMWRSGVGAKQLVARSRNYLLYTASPCLLITTRALGWRSSSFTISVTDQPPSRHPRINTSPHLTSSRLTSTLTTPPSAAKKIPTPCLRTCAARPMRDSPPSRLVACAPSHPAWRSYGNPRLQSECAWANEKLRAVISGNTRHGSKRLARWEYTSDSR
jgi:hypothetical protein